MNRLVGEQDIAPVPPGFDPRWPGVALPLAVYLCHPRTIQQLQSWAKRSSFSRSFMLQMLTWLENQYRAAYHNGKWETPRRQK